MTSLSKKRNKIIQWTTLFVLVFVFSGTGNFLYGGSKAGGHQPAVFYQEKINKKFKTLEDNLALLNNSGKTLETNANAFLSVAQNGIKLKKDINSVLNAIESQASKAGNFRQSFKLLVEQIDQLNNSIPITGSAKPMDLKNLEATGTDDESKGSSSEIISYGKRVSNVTATVQEVSRGMSAAEQADIVKQAEEVLRGDFSTFEKLFEEQLLNANKTVSTGEAFKGNISQFEKADADFVGAYNSLRSAINDLKIANRIAKVEPVVSEEYLQKLEEATLLLKEEKITALLGCTKTANVLNLFDLRNKMIKETVKNGRLSIKKIKGRHRGFFNESKLNVLIAMFILLGSILYFIYQAQQGKKLFIRKIAGLAALEDAVGRATEMGRPVLFVSGIRDIDDVQTLAGISILATVAKTTAEYDTKLFVPCCAPLAYSMAQEVVKESYLRAGRPDGYQRDDIRFLTSDQFGFVAGVSGIMIREEVAATFYLGKFFAESLILAETGNSIGAIQIAGTAETAQLPFFVAACDYTLIGEELFAASAYLAGEPRLLGSLKGQDVGKAIMILSIILGSIFQILISYGYLSESFSLIQLFMS